MTATVCKWLDEWEDRLWRMTRGVFHFLRWLPEWIIRVLAGDRGPGGGPGNAGVFRLVHLAGRAVQPRRRRRRRPGPVLGGPRCCVWLATAAAGSVYGLYRVAQKRRADAAAAAMHAAPPPVAQRLPA